MIHHANKRSVTANLKSEHGLALGKEMAARADIFVEKFCTRRDRTVGARLGGAARARPAPHFYAQVKGFGQGSPYEHNLLAVGILGALYRQHTHTAAVFGEWLTVGAEDLQALREQGVV